MKDRDYSIDILKFLAVFLIINSHRDALYVKYSMLETGGAIGDALFLFASGYTLLLSKRKLSFDNWYKRRISRIWQERLRQLGSLRTLLPQDEVGNAKVGKDIRLYELVFFRIQWKL